MDLYEREPDGRVHLYLFEMPIDGVTDRYGGDIPALSWEEAQSKVGLFGGTVIGVGACVIVPSLCAICSGEIVKDITSVEPTGSDEWGSVIGDD